MKAAVLGAGVIGQGWAVRFALFGWDVAVYDADPEAAARCSSLLDKCRAKVLTLYETLPESGAISQSEDLADVLIDADWVQESLPEDLGVKQILYRQVLEYLDTAPLCSSTSGFKPSDLFAEVHHTGGLFVCHPFNPVYLLPLVEVVAHSSVSGAQRQQVTDQLTSIGMYPLVIDKEIDAHIADRLLEAVWREALWMIKDGVATTAQIDAAITHGFGLRWAHMGLFETYRLGGGAGGMAHFLSQFAPALQWPWSRLTDVPELDEELIERIVVQSDAQSGAYSIEELSQARDDNLVEVLLALKARNWGAGAHLNGYRKNQS